MVAMAKQKPETNRPARDRHIEPREAFHLPQAMLDALIEFVADHKPETTKSAVIRLALEEFLVRAGRWPRKTRKTPADN
jgi:hypothetical protein